LLASIWQTININLLANSAPYFLTVALKSS